MSWTVLVLPQVEEDLASLDRGHSGLGATLRAAILDTFHDEFKSRRIREALEGSVRTSQVDRLEGSHYPQSFRLQLHHDYRATFVVMPAVDLVIVTCVFAKSRDPKYRQASRLHEARLAKVLDSFKDFLDRSGR